MKCFHCGNEMNELNMVLVSIDGDFVCDKKCEEEYEEEKAHFLNVTIHDDTLYDQWLYGGIGVSREELGL